MPIMTLRHGVATFKDSTGANTVALSPGPGNFTIDGLQEALREAIPIMNRGTFLEMVVGDEQPITGTITVLHDVPASSAVTRKILNGVLKTGAWASDTTDDPGGVVWTGIITLVGTRAGATETHTLTNVRLTAAYAEAGDGNTITLSYTAYGTGSGDAYAFASA